MAPEESRAAPAVAVGRPARWVLFAVVQAGLLTLTAPLVYYRIFGALTLYDDGGFMMMTVQHVLDGHRLYDEVLTAYGPVYYLYKWVLHGPFGLPLSHDVVRLNAAVLWLGTAVVSSGVVFAMTGGLALAAIAHVLTVLGLESIAVEPGHPQEMAVLIVVAFPSETYFFLADFAPHDASQLAETLRARNILIKPLNDERLGPGFMRVTTALPEDNARVIETVVDLLR